MASFPFSAIRKMGMKKGTRFRQVPFVFPQFEPLT
jgi:hypothetical protein